MCREVDTDLRRLNGLDREAEASRQIRVVRGGIPQHPAALQGRAERQRFAICAPSSRDPRGPQIGRHPVPPASRRVRAALFTVGHRWVALPWPPAGRHGDGLVAPLDEGHPFGAARKPSAEGLRP